MLEKSQPRKFIADVWLSLAIYPYMVGQSVCNCCHYGNHILHSYSLTSCCIKVCSKLASFSGPKRRRRKGLVLAVCACTYRGGIPPPLLHTIDILLYTCHANIDTKRYTVRRFITAAYGHARDSLDCTHPVTDLQL